MNSLWIGRWSGPLATQHARSSIASPRQATVLSIALFFILLAILVPGPAKNAIDTKWAIPTAMSFIRGHAGDVSEYVGTSGLEAITTIGERRYNFFPVGTPLLSVPAVAVVNLFDPSLHGRVKNFETTGLEKVIASIFGALTAVVFFWVIYSRFANVPIAVVSVLVLMFCTSMWSTATRALWSQGPFVLTITIAMLLLLRARSRPALAQYVSLPLAMAFVIRPSAAAPIAAFSLYVLLAYRAYFIKYLAWAALIALPFIAFNLFSFGSLFPPYDFHVHIVHNVPNWWALAAQLISPNRGLFIFSPVLLFSLSGFVLALRERDDLGLHLAFAAAVILHLLIISYHAAWWAGWSFGPRFMIDTLPYMVYFFAFNLHAIVPIDNARKATAAAAIGLLALISALIHAGGAYSAAPDNWNALPADIDRSPDRVWDWTDLQFTRGIPFINPRLASPDPTQR